MQCNYALLVYEQQLQFEKNDDDNDDDEHNKNI